MDLVVVCYDISKGFPKDEIFGLTSQLKRAAVSVPANISEGYGRLTRGEYINFLGIAQDSLKEIETHLLIAERLKFAGMEQIKKAFSLTEQIGKMLAALISSLKNKQISKP